MQRILRKTDRSAAISPRRAVKRGKRPGFALSGRHARGAVTAVTADRPPTRLGWRSACSIRRIAMNALRSCLLLAGLAAAATAQADDNLWVGAKAGTLGLGLEGTWRPIRWFDLRAGFNTFEYDDDGSEAGIDYDATLDLSTYYATANFRMPATPFRFTAGLYNNGNELRLVSREMTGPVEIGDATFSPAEVGTLRGLASFDDVAPYAGIGLDFGLFGKVGLNLDLGVLFQGAPDIALTADGALANDPVFQDALESERAELQEEVDRYELYPVASLTFTVQFL
jgi:hypothetical protein